MEINKQTLLPFLVFNQEIKYNDVITLYPIKMKDIIAFQQFQSALILNKNSIFREKNIIKMNYFEFIKYSYMNQDLAEKYEKYNIVFLPLYFEFILSLLQIVCGDNAKIVYTSSLDIYINDILITNEIFDDLRKIILIQNDVDFDIDEFINFNTLKDLEETRLFEAKKKKEKSDLEDYIDSIVIILNIPKEQVNDITIRNFWRYVKRINMHEDYQACLTGQMSGMVTFKEPMKHWMSTLDIEDKYSNLKANEQEVRNKII